MSRYSLSLMPAAASAFIWARRIAPAISASEPPADQSSDSVSLSVAESAFFWSSRSSAS